MWIVSKSKETFSEAKCVWKNKLGDGNIAIYCSYGGTEESELYHLLGEYEAARADLICEDIQHSIAMDRRLYNMPEK